MRWNTFLQILLPSLEGIVLTILVMVILGRFVQLFYALQLVLGTPSMLTFLVALALYLRLVRVHLLLKQGCPRL